MNTQDSLIVHEQKALMTSEGMKVMQEQAKQLFMSGLCPKSISKWEQVLIIGLYGRELDLPMIRSLNEIHVIDGHPGISAKLMNIKVRENLPHAQVDVLEKTDKICRIRFQRSPNHKPVEVSYTIEEAQKAGLTGKNNWKNHPVDMLFARCISRMVREECPEAVHGFVYTPEELQDAKDAPAQTHSGEPAVVKGDAKTVEAEFTPAPKDDAMDEDAVMDFVAVLADLNEEGAAEEAHRKFADHWTEKSPATAAEGTIAYRNRIQRIRDSKAVKA
jgi:hypothetical protein